jgi:hypothetical protein
MTAEGDINNVESSKQNTLKFEAFAAKERSSYSQFVKGILSEDKMQGLEAASAHAGGGGEQIYEEGELIDSGSGNFDGKGQTQEGEKTLVLTQQSSIFENVVTDMETEGEELVDYEEEPINKEKAKKWQI